MDSDWLHRIAPYPRPSEAGTPPERSFTGTATQKPGWLEPRRIIYDHQLVLVRSGAFRIEIDDQSFFCGEGTFLIIPPGCWETIWHVDSGRAVRCWCHFDWIYRGPWGRTPIMTYFPGQPRRAFLRPAPEFVPAGVLWGEIPAPEVAFEFFDRLLRQHLFGDAREQLASRAILLELLLHLLDRDRPRPLRERSVQLAETVRQQLKAAVDSGRPMESIQALLERLGYSYAHLSRVFHAEYGISPLKYAQTLRIDRAKLLLRDTSLSVSEIAYRVGLGDAGYFARLFRQIVGRSPSAFREAVN